MFDQFSAVRDALAAAASEFDAALLRPDAGLRAVEELGTIRRLVDGMLAKAAKRVADATPVAEGGTRAGSALVADRWGRVSARYAPRSSPRPGSRICRSRMRPYAPGCSLLYKHR